MTAQLPAEAGDLVTSNVPVIVSYHDARGRIVSFPIWVEVVGANLQFSTPRGSKKTVHLRHDPEVGVIFTDRANPFRYLSVSARVVDVHDDVDLAVIDHLAQRFVGGPYRDRTGRREVFVLEPTRVTFSTGTRG